MGKKVTQNDIATALNLSRVTVSKVLNNCGNTSEKIKQIVYDKARELGYRFVEESQTAQPAPLQAAVKIVRHRVAFVCYLRDFNCNYWASIIRGISDVLSKKKISLGIVLISDDYDKRCELPNELYDGDIDGIIVAGALSCQYFKLIHSLGKPMVSIDIDVSLYKENLICDVILAENIFGFFNIVKLLCKSGYRKFAYIGGKNCMQSFYERWVGFALALQESNIPIRNEWMATDGGTYSYYYEGVVEEIVRNYPEPPEVIVCFNDSIAARINKMKQDPENVNIQKETVVVGFDNSKEFSSHMMYDFNVECFPEEIGRTAADTIIWRMDHPDRPFHIARTMVELVIPEDFKESQV